MLKQLRSWNHWDRTRSKTRNSGKIAEFNSTQVIISVVRDSQSDKVISPIMEVAHTGQNKDGKNFVTDVRDTHNISKK